MRSAIPVRRERFTITARCKEGMRSSTRGRPASAMVLADRWAREGCDDIRVTNADGVVRSPEAFRSTLLFVRQFGGRAVVDEA